MANGKREPIDLDALLESLELDEETEAQLRRALAQVFQRGVRTGSTAVQRSLSMFGSGPQAQAQQAPGITGPLIDFPTILQGLEQPGQSGPFVQFLGGSRTPVEPAARIGALGALGTNLMTAISEVLRKRKEQQAAEGGQ